MAIIEVSIVPIGTPTPSLSDYVARAFAVLQHQKALKYELTPMGTIVEGDLDEALKVIRQMHDSVFGEGVRRVVTKITIDDRRDKAATMEDKVSSVKDKLGKS